MDKCAGQDCNKHFHVLCAYLQGYEIDLIECDDSKDDKAKNGFSSHIFCADHARNPNVKVIENFSLILYREILFNNSTTEDIRPTIKIL